MLHAKHANENAIGELGVTNETASVSWQNPLLTANHMNKSTVLSYVVELISSWVEPKKCQNWNWSVCSWLYLFGLWMCFLDRSRTLKRMASPKVHSCQQYGCNPDLDVILTGVNQMWCSWRLMLRIAFESCTPMTMMNIRVSSFTLCYTCDIKF